MAVPWKVNSSSTYAFTQHSGYHKNPSHSRPCHLATHRNRAPGAWLYRNCMNVLSRSVVSDSLRSHDCSSPGSSAHGDSPGKNNGVGCHAPLQGIFPTQGLNPGLLHCGQILYCLSHQGSPYWSSHFSILILATKDIIFQNLWFSQIYIVLEK